jgi:hypothetical protein
LARAASSLFNKNINSETSQEDEKSYFSRDPHLYTIKEATSVVAEGKTIIECPNHVEYPVSLDEIIPGMVWVFSGV